MQCASESSRPCPDDEHICFQLFALNLISIRGHAAHLSRTLSRTKRTQTRRVICRAVSVDSQHTNDAQAFTSAMTKPNTLMTTSISMSDNVLPLEPCAQRKTPHM